MEWNWNKMEWNGIFGMEWNGIGIKWNGIGIKWNGMEYLEWNWNGFVCKVYKITK
jgi:hypothetical protein